MSDPKSIIEKLILSGMQESEIAPALREAGVEVTSATINRIKTGGIKRTSFDIGMGLVALYQAKTKQARKRA